MGDESRETLTIKARFAEQAERYEDMAKVRDTTLHPTHRFYPCLSG